MGIILTKHCQESDFKMNYFPCTILAFVAVSSSLALPLDPPQLQQFIQQLQLQFPSSGGVAAQIPLPPFIQNILANLPSSQATGRTLDASQLPIPPFLQNIVSLIQSSSSQQAAGRSDDVAADIEDIQTGTLPPL